MKPSGSPQPFLEARGLVKHLGHQEVLRGIDLTVNQGEIITIIGGSGTGKSVLVKHFVGLMHPTSGSVFVDGEDITRLKERQLAPVRRKIGFMFQNGALFDSLSVAMNVGFPLRVDGKRDESEINHLVEDALSVVDLTGHGHKMPNEISGGMRKRVALARAVVNKPACVLYDEPTAGLDPIVTDVIDQLILRLRHRYNMTAIVITHDMKTVFNIADRVLFLREGIIHFQGTPAELKACEDPLVTDFINGRSGVTSE